MRYSYPPILEPILRMPRRERSILGLFFFAGATLVLAFFLVLFFSVYRITSSSLKSAHAQNARTRMLAQVHALEQFFLEARHEILNIAQSDPSLESVRKYFQDADPEKRRRYREIAFHSAMPGYSFILLNTGDGIWKVPDEQAAGIKFGTFSLGARDGQNIRRYVKVEAPFQVYYSSVPIHGAVENMEFSVIRLVAPVFTAGNGFSGYLTLSLDIREIQQIMSLYVSKNSPLYMVPQEQEYVRTFFFDATGWLICEATPATPERRISVDSLRTGLMGDVGRPGFSTAFRPSPQYEAYWTAVYDVQAGRSGLIDSSTSFLNDLEQSNTDVFLHYAPLSFEETPGSPVVVGGVGCVDSSFMLKAGRHSLIQGLGYAMLAAALIAFCVFFFLYRRINVPIKRLVRTLAQRMDENAQDSVQIPALPKELSRLQHMLNGMLGYIRELRGEAELHRISAQDELHRQPVLLEQIAGGAGHVDESEGATGIVGESRAIRALRDMIRKTAQVMADVLIIGETGTGKELTAEAIHRGSTRPDGPFISINCGALDENLLLDALFGHVKGAFSEAKTDRKGAFLAASGGTLLLDEIGNASAKVQQALLRALSVRLIRPLGSDRDVPFDARVIAATNVDLLEGAKNGKFREDLYYRLAVVTIATPPLRQRKEDIPALVRCFLLEASSFLKREPMQVSRGALDKMLRHDWPGNVRELKNCITRALTFAEGDILLDRHIVLEGGDEVLPVRDEHAPAVVAGGADSRVEQTVSQAPEQASSVFSKAAVPLNARQRKAWPSIVAAGGTNRVLYQQWVEENISVRTAQYDLQDFVSKGLLSKLGKGPSSRYVVVRKL